MAVTPDINAWEDKVVLTEKEKREFTKSRIEGELDGNPNLKALRRERKIRFKTPTKEIEDRMKLLDHLGNPISGYKWGKFNKKKNWCELVKDKKPLVCSNKDTLNGFSIVNRNHLEI